MKTTIYTHPSAMAHDTGAGHPECAARIGAIESVQRDYPRGRIAPATHEQLLRAHPFHYIQSIEDGVPGRGLRVLDGGDTILSPASHEALLMAAGAPCSAIDDIMAGNAARAFCAMRPPGHHAEPARAMGFCFFNNIFIGARHAQARHGLKKIAIVDFDVHHGNGTDIMTRMHDGSVLYLSTHQAGIFPHSGLEIDNEDSVRNFTLPAGADGEQLLALYRARIVPALESFKPDLLMLSAGFDAHRDDPLAGWTLEADDFFRLTKELAAIADRHCHGRVVSVLEGGYNQTALSESLAAHLRALDGEEA